MTAVSRARDLRSLGPDVDLALENKLKMSLRPVRPNPDFVDNLHTRLSSPQVVLEKQRNRALSMLLVAMSLVGGVILLWISRRWRHPTAAAV